MGLDIYRLLLTVNNFKLYPLRYSWRDLDRLLIMRSITLKLSATRDRCEVHVDDEYFSQKGLTMENFQSLLRQVKTLQLVVDRLYEDADGFTLLYSRYSLRGLPQSVRTLLVTWQTAQSPSEDLSVDSYAVVAAAAALLLLVYHYLTGYVDRGGSKAYSSGSLDFRDTFIPIILFHGAYVWIKSRDVPKGVSRKVIPDKRGNTRVVFEPRFKPSHRKHEPSRYIYVGRYDTPEEASILYEITAICYHGQGGLLQFEDGDFLMIPPMADNDRRRIGADKRKFVADEARRVYKAYVAERANAAQPGELQVVGVDRTNSDCLNSAGATYGAPLPGIGIPPGDRVDAVGAQAFTVSSAFQEGVAASNTQSGMSLSSENELFRTLVSNQQEMISLQRQQLQALTEARHQQDIEHQQLKLQLAELQKHQCFQHMNPRDFSIQHFQPLQDHLQVTDQGMPTLQASVDPSSDGLFGYLNLPES